MKTKKNKKYTNKEVLEIEESARRRSKDLEVIKPKTSLGGSLVKSLNEALSHEKGEIKLRTTIKRK